MVNKLSQYLPNHISLRDVNMFTWKKATCQIGVWYATYILRRMLRVYNVHFQQTCLSWLFQIFTLKLFRRVISFLRKHFGIWGHIVWVKGNQVTEDIPGLSQWDQRGKAM